MSIYNVSKKNLLLIAAAVTVVFCLVLGTGANVSADDFKYENAVDVASYCTKEYPYVYGVATTTNLACNQGGAFAMEDPARDVRCDFEYAISIQGGVKTDPALERAACNNGFKEVSKGNGGKAVPDPSGSNDTAGNQSVDCDPNAKRTFFDWGGSTCGDDVIPRVLLMIFDWAAVGVGTVVLAMVVIGGIQYMSVRDSKDKAAQGITTIRTAVIALLLYAVVNTRFIVGLL
jgi:hypothetical protein